MTLHNLTARAICILVLSAVGCGRLSTPTPTAKTLHEAAIFYPDQIPTLIAKGAEVDELDAAVGNEGEENGRLGDRHGWSAHVVSLRRIFRWQCGRSSRE